MSDQPSPAIGRCPECGAELVQADRCWLCGREFPVMAELVSPAPPAATPPIPPLENSWTFGLSSLMLVITLAAVFMGLVAIAPGLAVLLAIVSTPALIRTFVVSARRKSAGERLTPSQKFATFMGAVGVAILAYVTAMGAFFVTCAIACGVVVAAEPSGSSSAFEAILYIGLAVAALAGIAAYIWVLKAAWKKRK
jgi:hypothetical protein